MASKNAFFNIRPTRRSNPEARTTLDALHTYHISQIKDKTNHIDDLKTEMATVLQKKGGGQNPIELSAIEEQESELVKFFIIITIYRIKFREVLILLLSV